jgi:hypothetical protein
VTKRMLDIWICNQKRLTSEFVVKCTMKVSNCGQIKGTGFDF